MHSLSTRGTSVLTDLNGHKIYFNDVQKYIYILPPTPLPPPLLPSFLPFLISPRAFLVFLLSFCLSLSPHCLVFYLLVPYILAHFLISFLSWSADSQLTLFVSIFPFLPPHFNFCCYLPSFLLLPLLPFSSPHLPTSFLHNHFSFPPLFLSSSPWRPALLSLPWRQRCKCCS